MTEKQESLVRDACAIITSFQGMLSGDILEKTGTLYVSDSFQDLGTACALLGEALGDASMPRRVVENEATRTKLAAAYQAAEIVKSNAKEGTELIDICASLAACAYSALNLTATEAGMADALQKEISAAGFAIEILDGVAEAGPASLEPMYLNPSGQVLHDRLGQFYDTFRPLMPAPAAADAETGGETDHETDQQQQ